MMSEEKFKRRLDLNEQQRSELFAHLDSHQTPEQSKRQHIRYTFHVADVPLVIQHPDGGVSRFLVYGRNVSTRGVAVLHGGYVHTGSACQIILSTTGDNHLSVPGVVRHCRLIAGSCHEIGILFDDEIDPSQIAGSDASASSSGADEETLGYHSMAGRVLVVDPFVPSRMLLEHQLNVFGLQVTAASSSDDALTKHEAADPPFNLVLAGLSGPNDIDAVQRLRQTEFVGPIIALTPEADAEQLKLIQNAGAGTVLLQPVSTDVLLAHLQAYLGKATAAGTIYSTAEDQPGMRTLVNEYVRGVRVLSEELETAIEAKDAAAARAVIMRLRGSGTAFGFNDVSVAAIRALTDLDRTGATESAAESIKELARCCAQIAVSKPADQAA